MNHTAHYRATLPHQLHPNQTSHLQPAFPGRFPTANLDNINAAAVMLPTIGGHQEHVQYSAHMQPFVNSTSVRQNEQHIKATEQRKNRSFSTDDRERRENCQENYKSNNTENQFPQTGQQCFKPGPVIPNSRNRVMVDASTMTDPEEDDTTSNWQNVSVPTNTKVAEYLSSLRQFLKLSTPGEKKKKQLGDVRIMTGADGTRLFCCPECHVAYPDKSLLEPHLAGHKIERRWVCGVCGAGLKRKEHLDRHQLCHTDERPFACQACPKAFKRNEHLARHYVTHSGDKAQVCTDCGKAFYRKDHLRKHLRRHLSCPGFPPHPS